MLANSVAQEYQGSRSFSSVFCIIISMSTTPLMVKKMAIVVPDIVFIIMSKH